MRGFEKGTQIGVVPDGGAAGGDGDTVPAEGGTRPDAAQIEAGKLLWKRFRVQRELGRGGMGVVYLAWDEELSEPRAVKLLPGAAVGNLAAVERFRDEVRAAKRLKHEHIVKVDDIHVDADRVGLSMEFVDGLTLAHHLDGSVPDSPFQAADPRVRVVLAWILARQLGSALDHVHAQQLVHCDLKPSNILISEARLDPDGTVVLNAQLADFGIARALGRAQVQGGGSSGTRAFMAPEVSEGALPTAAADVYGLGLVLQRVLAGAGGVADVTAGHVSVSPRVEKILASCVAVDPGQRPASAGDVAQAFEPETPEPPEEPAPPVPSPPARRGRLVGWTILAFFYLMAVLAGVVGFVLAFANPAAALAYSLIGLPAFALFAGLVNFRRMLVHAFLMGGVGWCFVFLGSALMAPGLLLHELVACAIGGFACGIVGVVAALAVRAVAYFLPPRDGAGVESGGGE